MNDFEKACEKYESDRNYELEEENVISFLRGGKMATATFTQGRYITKIEKLAEKFPEDVKIVARNENSIVCHFPVRFIKINNPTREISDEEREVMRERFLASRNTIK